MVGTPALNRVMYVRIVPPEVRNKCVNNNRFVLRCGRRDWTHQIHAGLGLGP